MSNRLFSRSSDYLHCLRGMHQLHALNLSGQDQTDEANRIRGQMEQVWWNLSETEQERLDGLSEDLYTLSDGLWKPSPTTPETKLLQEQYDHAVQTGNWDEALNSLRLVAHFLEPAAVSTLRGSIWQSAGDPETAELFYEHSAHGPRNGQSDPAKWPLFPGQIEVPQ